MKEVVIDHLFTIAFVGFLTIEINKLFHFAPLTILVGIVLTIYLVRFLAEERKEQ